MLSMQLNYCAANAVSSLFAVTHYSAIKMYSRILAVLVFGFRYAMRYSDSFALVGLIIHSIVRWMAESEVIAFVKAHGGWVCIRLCIYRRWHFSCWNPTVKARKLVCARKSHLIKASSSTVLLPNSAQMYIPPEIRTPPLFHISYVYCR